MEIQKKADFSETFLVPGRQVGGQETTGEPGSIAAGRVLKGTGCPDGGDKGARKRGGERLLPTEGQGEGYGKVCVRDRQAGRWSACVAGLCLCISQR